LLFASGTAPLDAAAPYQFIAWRRTPGTAPGNAEKSPKVSVLSVNESPQS
jgi:hypothetical protein